MLSTPTSVAGNKHEVKLSFCLVKQHTITKNGGTEVYLHVFLTVAVVGGDHSPNHQSTLHNIPEQQRCLLRLVLGTNVSLSTQFLNSLSLWSSLKVRDQVSHTDAHIKQAQ